MFITLLLSKMYISNLCNKIIFCINVIFLVIDNLESYHYILYKVCFKLKKNRKKKYMRFNK